MAHPSGGGKKGSCDQGKRRRATYHAQHGDPGNLHAEEHCKLGRCCAEVLTLPSYCQAFRRSLCFDDQGELVGTVTFYFADRPSTLC